MPIIKCVHKKTGYPLDINTSSGHGVYNSEFLEKLIKSDPRFQSAILVLRIWARYRDINKVGGMNSYCLTLLFFFYLQHLEIVPSFKTIQAWAKPIMFDDINFGLNPQAIGHSNDGATIRQLVEGFFEFYHNFDFEHRIICLHLGHAINWEFLKLENNFPVYHTQLELVKKKQSADAEPEKVGLPLSNIVVQDPFCLYQNTSKSVTPSLLERIQKLMSLTNVICQQSRDLPDQKWLVRVLYEIGYVKEPVEDILSRNLGPKAQQRLNKKKGNHETAAAKQEPSAPKEAAQPRKFTFTLSPLDQELFYIRNHLRQEFPGEMFTLPDIYKIWSEKVVEYLKKIQTDILGLEVEVSNKFSKSPKSNSQEDVHSDKLNFTATVSTELDLWTGRNMTKKTSFGNLLKEQIALTKSLEEVRQKGGAKPVNISATLTVQVSPNFNIEVDWVDHVGSKSKLLFDFFSSSVRPLLKGYLEINLIKDGKF